MQMQMFARISKHRKAMGSGPRDSGPWDPGTQDAGAPSKFKNMTWYSPPPLKFKRETPGPPSKFKSRTPGLPSKVKNGTLIIKFLHFLTYYIPDKYIFII